MSRRIVADIMPHRRLGDGYRRVLTTMPEIASGECQTHAYCRRWETPPSGSDGRRFRKAHRTRTIRRQLARQLASILREDA